MPRRRQGGHVVIERMRDEREMPIGPPFRAEPVEIWRARGFIRDHLFEALSLVRVARAANISPGYLSEKFKEVTGENVVRYIAKARVAKAEELLQNSETRISEIAFAVGFQSLSQFNRVFKRMRGRTPTQARNTPARRAA